MKKTDIAMIIFIASISMLVAFFITRAFFGGQPNQAVKVKTIEAINSNIQEPDTSIFNENAINPTYEVNVGASTTSTSSTTDTTAASPQTEQ